ncbi:hypothetical protein CTA1_8470 [Colletotrichum tanaceti]|uniref:Uncharacterized protein n=1 Tax=Colletotrichum tanaceti TaxID=1306861 RepID=A0A4U6X9V5_9PEZI|nr:hypothetical protein CTA1_8470 [Colletotrichum tanaceti]
MQSRHHRENLEVQTTSYDPVPSASDGQRGRLLHGYASTRRQRPTTGCGSRTFDPTSLTALRWAGRVVRDSPVGFKTIPSETLPPGAEFLKHRFLNGGHRLWKLHPGLFRATGRAEKWHDDFAQMVVPSINQLIQRRRQMQTPLTLPDGTASFPGQSMKPYQFYLEELTYPEEDATHVLAHNANLLNRSLLTGSTRVKLSRKAAKKKEPLNPPNGGGSAGGGVKNNKGTLADRKGRNKHVPGSRLGMGVGTSGSYLGSSHNPRPIERE